VNPDIGRWLVARGGPGRAVRDPLVLVRCDLGPAVGSVVERDPRYAREADLQDGSCDPSRIVGVVVRSESRVDAHFLDCFPNLAVVIRAGSGVDNLDLDQLRRRDILLLRHPGLSAAAVAELAWLALLVLARRVALGHEALRRHAWLKGDLSGEPTAELQVTVWGGGPVGRAVADLFDPLCGNVGFVRWPSLSSELPSIDRDDALRSSDVHVLCLPLRPATKELFNEAVLAVTASARPYVLNVGRFELLAFGAAARRVGRGELRGLFVDAVEARHVPLVAQALAAKGPPLNLLATPHLGAQRRDVLERLGTWVLEVTRQVLEVLCRQGDGFTGP
jgi:D-3-phosphoglycerate dehydrogenase / 2-oxoglutarate reductase